MKTKRAEKELRGKRNQNENSSHIQNRDSFSIKIFNIRVFAFKVMKYLAFLIFLIDDVQTFALSLRYHKILKAVISRGWVWACKTLKTACSRPHFDQWEVLDGEYSGVLLFTCRWQQSPIFVCRLKWIKISLRRCHICGVCCVYCATASQEFTQGLKSNIINLRVNLFFNSI